MKNVIVVALPIRPKSLTRVSILYIHDNEISGVINDGKINLS